LRFAKDRDGHVGSRDEICMSMFLQDILYFSVDSEECPSSRCEVDVVEKWSLRGVVAELRLALGVWR
jgi:hypothetical protein